MKTNYLIKYAPSKSIERIFKFGLMFFILLCMSWPSYAQLGCNMIDLETKHIQRNLTANPNLLNEFNSEFTTEGADDWEHYRGCPTSQSSRWVTIGNNGCIELRGPVDISTGLGCPTQPSLTFDQIIFPSLEIEADRTHTISLKCMTLEGGCHTLVNPPVCDYDEYVIPSPVLNIQLQGLAQNGTMVANSQRNFNFSTARANQWEEFAFFFKMPTDVASVRIRVQNLRRDTPLDEGLLAYVDNIYVGEGKGFEDAPSCKTPFTGSNIRVDELGNVFTQNADGTEDWFFPAIIHGDTYRDVYDPTYSVNQDGGWELYRQQGFNAIITGNADYFIEDAIDVGLKVVRHLGSYYTNCIEVPCATTYIDCDPLIDQLEARLQYMATTNDDDGKPYLDHLLFHFIDNEIEAKWNEMREITTAVQEWEAAYLASINSPFDRISPIDILNGTPGLAPKYLQVDGCHVGDITGTYISSGDKHTPNHRWTTLDHQNNQSMPTVIAQINGNTAVRARVLGAIAHGARGMDFWRDFAPNNPNYIAPGGTIPSNDITEAPWWDGFPSLIGQINNMSQLIQQPHWTNDWSVEACTNNGLDCDDTTIAYGTRDFVNDQGILERYIIVANYGIDDVANLQFTFEGLPFNNADIVLMDENFEENTVVQTLSANSFTFPLFLGEEAEVYKIVNKCPEDLVLVSDVDLFVGNRSVNHNPLATTLTDIQTPPSFVFANTSLEVLIRLRGALTNESEIGIEITDPAGNVLPITLPPSTSWNGTPWRYFVIDVPNGVSTGNPNDWTIKFSDSNTQYDNFDYRVGFIRLTYSPTDGTCTDEEMLLSGNNTSAILIDDINTESQSISNKAMSVYPIPAMDKLNIDYHSNSTSPLKIEVLSNDGKVLITQDATVKEGLNTVQLDIEQLSAGYYFIRAYSTDDLPQVQSFVKMSP